jgi:hypothetical protein
MQVYGRDGLSGPAASPFAPSSVVPVKGHEKLRTYRVLDKADNLLTLVLNVKTGGHDQTVEVVSLRYGSGPVITRARTRSSSIGTSKRRTAR